MMPWHVCNIIIRLWYYPIIWHMIKWPLTINRLYDDNLSFYSVKYPKYVIRTPLGKTRCNPQKATSLNDKNLEHCIAA